MMERERQSNGSLVDGCACHGLFGFAPALRSSCTCAANPRVGHHAAIGRVWLYDGWQKRLKVHLRFAPGYKQTHGKEKRNS